MSWKQGGWVGAPVLHMPPPPPPPLQRCCWSKNTLALKGPALAGVATPMRTDHAMTANNIVLMAISPPTKDIVSTPPKLGFGTGNAGHARDRHRAHESALNTQLAASARPEDIGITPDFRSDTLLRGCFADIGLGRRQGRRRPQGIMRSARHSNAQLTTAFLHVAVMGTVRTAGQSSEQVPSCPLHAPVGVPPERHATAHRSSRRWRTRFSAACMRPAARQSEVKCQYCSQRHVLSSECAHAGTCPTLLAVSLQASPSVRVDVGPRNGGLFQSGRAAVDTLEHSLPPCGKRRSALQIVASRACGQTPAFGRAPRSRRGRFERHGR